MNEHSRQPLDKYYREAATWNHDRIDSLRSSRRVAWYVAAGTAVFAVIEGLALLLLMPLKTVQPYTIMVDRTTGYVQALNPLDTVKLAPDTALTQSFLAQYVVAREGFDIDTVRINHRKVALLSAGSARSSYLSAMQASNPSSPLNAYPRGTIVETRIKSVSPVGKNVALVRFDTVRMDANGQIHPISPSLAVIRYEYSGEPMKLEDRLVNPLGFRVLRYRRDAEAAPTAVPASTQQLPGTVASPTPSAPSNRAATRTAAPDNYYHTEAE